MKYSLSITAALISALVLTTGCSKTADEPPLPRIGPSDQSMSLPLPKTTLTNPTLPSTRLPDPIVPRGGEEPKPMPGQANDHSNPEFKNGGRPDSSK